MMTMTHRDRVLSAISHKQPDTVPIDLGGTRDSSIVVEGYEKLKEHFGFEAENEFLAGILRVVKVDERILKQLDIDVRCVSPGAPIKARPVQLGPNRFRDIWGVERVMPESSYYYDQTDFPLAGKRTISDIANYPFPDPNDPGFVEPLRERLRWVRENTDCAAIIALPPPFIHLSQYLRGYEDWYCDVALNTDFLEALFDAILEVTLQIAKNMLEEVGNDMDVAMCGDDVATQSGLQVSPEYYRKYLKPRQEKYIRQIHEMSDARVIYHTCGSVFGILDDLIEIGVDALNPVQTSAVGMDPVQLKKKYGDRLCFWGAIDTQSVLNRGTVQDVKKMVEDRIEQLGEGGGYVLAACHNIQPDVPLKNTLAMFEHAREYVPSFAK